MCPHPAQVLSHSALQSDVLHYVLLQTSYGAQSEPAAAGATAVAVTHVPTAVHVEFLDHRRNICLSDGLKDLANLEAHKCLEEAGAIFAAGEV